MQKIAIMGAGSVTFARMLVNDLLFFEPFKDAEFRLMDVDPDRLDFAENTLRLVNEVRKTNASFTVTTDRREALDGADFAITMIQVGGLDATRTDFEVCRNHGLKLVIGDSMGIPGISRALRTIPALLDITRDMEAICPDAHLLNYTNPMGMVMSSLLRGSSVDAVGLCHGVFGTARRLAQIIDVPYEKIRYLCAGINHLAFFLKFEADGKDAYPLIRKAFDTTHADQELVRQEMFRRLGYFMTESSYHLSEYLPYFIKSDELIEEYDIAVDEYVLRSEEAVEIFEKVHQAFVEGRNLLAEGGQVTFVPRSRMRRGHAEPGEEVAAFRIPDRPSGEYASRICNAIATGDTFVFNGNVLNTGLITNLPDNTCVEVPCLVDGNGIQPTHVGELPPQCAAVIQTNLNVQELTARGILEQNRDYIYHAALVSTLASAVLSTREIYALMDELLEAHRHLVPDWCLK
ncbi:MAG: alpha-galactosidase [Candidatus Latescibacteria bacterium]|jgi:alpha-galactosidase|nr:alpha-galactosidase [Candidatus Latescibacterota bacterium]